MPYRLLAASKLGEFLGVIAHPKRIQIIEELRGGEADVGTLKEILHVSHSNVSQHLGLLRAHRIVEERREGRQVFYRLRCEKLAGWLVQGMKYLPEVSSDNATVKHALQDAEKAWTKAVKTTGRTSASK